MTRPQPRRTRPRRPMSYYRNRNGICLHCGWLRTKFRTREEAEDRIAYAKTMRWYKAARKREMEVGLCPKGDRPYRCNVCGFWHI